MKTVTARNINTQGRKELAINKAEENIKAANLASERSRSPINKKATKTKPNSDAINKKAEKKQEEEDKKQNMKQKLAQKKNQMQ